MTGFPRRLRTNTKTATTNDRWRLGVSRQPPPRALAIRPVTHDYGWDVRPGAASGPPAAECAVATSGTPADKDAFAPSPCRGVPCPMQPSAAECAGVPDGRVVMGDPSSCFGP